MLPSTSSPRLVKGGEPTSRRGRSAVTAAALAAREVCRAGCRSESLEAPVRASVAKTRSTTPGGHDSRMAAESGVRRCGARARELIFVNEQRSYFVEIARRRNMGARLEPVSMLILYVLWGRGGN